jgi:hypothetical protein
MKAEFLYRLAIQGLVKVPCWHVVNHSCVKRTVHNLGVHDIDPSSVDVHSVSVQNARFSSAVIKITFDAHLRKIASIFLLYGTLYTTILICR